ncbi:sulfite exporter TauE/SafE family protein [Agromyces sp. LHK192]|uniref:sulfite exporter TauE/SafE family protein n=1 Tax=Agromyces sp. LHK192 TaxID=2498704 RepID=UPI000FDB5D64|nr:sulfite exporter TauE/SafE family protein [Agromyces sp. LHK192]
MLLAVSLSVLVGAFAQRVTGMGFALVASPALVLLLGPFDGVFVVNLCAVLSSLLILPRVWRAIDWPRLARLLPAAIVGTAVGAVVAASVPGPALQFGIGVLVLVALTATLLASRTARVPDRLGVTLAAGGASGFMNAAAGVGGPAIAVYAIATRWPQPAFAATNQPYFVAIGVASLVGKFAASGWSLPELDPSMWIAVAVAVVLGLVVGELLHRRIGNRAARIGVIVLAYLGAAAATVDGAIELLA